jgi:5-(hydroxymethyl)furfural/furfural oxidase
MQDEQALEGFVRENVTSTWHPCGTCRIGRPDDAGAVVDPQGRVHGATGLWVADASVMPEIPRANTNIPTIMIAEKIADHLAEAIRT